MKCPKCKKNALSKSEYKDMTLYIHKEEIKYGLLVCTDHCVVHKPAPAKESN